MIPAAVTPAPPDARARRPRLRAAALILAALVAGCAPATSGAPEPHDKGKVSAVGTAPVEPEPAAEPAVDPEAAADPPAAPPVPPGCTAPAQHAPCDPYPVPVEGVVEQDGVACVAPAPAGASDAAVAYVAAAAAATPGWAAVDEHLVGHSPLTYDIDLVAQVDADALFLAGLRAAPFPEDVAPLAGELMDAVVAYDDFLIQASHGMDYYGDHQDVVAELSQTRADASGRLREALGLPGSTCAFYRP